MGCGCVFHGACKKAVALKGEFADRDCTDVCASHFCQKCRTPFKLDEKAAKCIRCYKAYHAWQASESTQCYDLEQLVPVSDSHFLCRDHLEADVASLVRTD